MFLSILNLKDYTPTEHALFAVGCLMWVVTYVIVIQYIVQRKTVGIPWIPICANFSWEFLWSFVFTPDMGELYAWGYKLWFFLDCFILYGMFVYGSKQLTVPKEAARYATLIFVIGLASWMAMLYYYIDKWDAPVTHMGANSGYILNVMMSAIFIDFLYKQDIRNLSFAVAWLKGVGTFLISIFCFLHFQDGFLLSMCVVTTLLDALYIALFASRMIEATMKESRKEYSLA